MNNHFASILKEIGIEGNITKNISKDIREKYLNQNKWHLYDDTVFCLKSAIKKIL